MNIKKKTLILISLVLIVGLAACTKNFTCDTIDCKIKSGNNVNIFIATDPHHLSKKIYDNGEAFKGFLASGDGKLLHYSEEIIDAFIMDVENEKPDILIFPGDLTCNGEKESHLEFANKLKGLKKLGIHVFVLPGNHDIENPWAREYNGNKLSKIDSISSEEFAHIYASYGYRDALSRDSNSLSYLTTPSEDIWLLMLDSSKYIRNNVRSSPEMGGFLTTQTLDWIKQCGELAKDNNAKLIAVAHHSVLDHSRIINRDYTIDNADELRKILLKYGVQIVLTGHIHLQDIKSYQENGSILYDIATSCLIAYPNQYASLSFIPSKGYYYQTKRVDVSNWVKENNISDENLINFQEYSRDFFKRRSYDKYYDLLLEIGKYSDTEMESISKIMAILNPDYFAGFRNDALDHVLSMEGFNLVQNSAPQSIKDYALSMFNDENTDNNKLFIPINSNGID